MDGLLEQYYEFREDFGQKVIVPLSADIREYFEGPDAPRHPSWFARGIDAKSPTMSTEDLLTIAGLAIFLTIFERIMATFFTMPLARLLDLKSEDQVRFKESFWQMSFYAPSWVCSALVAYEAPWFHHTYLHWEPPFPHQEMSVLTYWIFMVQMGWYLHCSFAHLVLDTRKSDFWVMIIHHVAALALLYLSFTMGYFRTGLATMFCLDICDVSLHLTKIFRLLDNRYQWPLVVSVIIYLQFVFSWAAFRLYLFPIKCLYPASFQGMHYGGWMNADHWLVFNGFLLIIYLLQVYWFYLILLSGYKFIRFGDQLDDERDRSTIEEPPKPKSKSE